jgi:N-acetylmuramoyl-L-alanine amidase
LPLNSKAKKFGVLLGIVVAIAAGIAAPALLGQTQPAAVPAMNRSVVVLDPAHGGPDAGAKLGDRLLEKDVTLALAARLRATLTAAGFTVVSTRDADSFNPLTNDQRAETANRAHAVACLVIHATGTGEGVHLFASTLQPKDPPAAGDDFEPTPWETAQAESVGQSLRLESDLGGALGAAKMPVVVGRAAVRPLDSLMCPAVAVEVAPLTVAGGGATPVSDPEYQQRLAETLTRALQTWRGHADAHAAATAEDGAKTIPAEQTQAAAKARAAADAAGAAALKARGNGGTQ